MRKSLGYEIFMTALVLVIIAGVAGAVLGLVNFVTQVDEGKLLTEKAESFFGGNLEHYVAPEGFMREMVYDHADVIDVFQSTKDREAFVLIVEGEGAYKGTLQLLVNITDGTIKKIKRSKKLGKRNFIIVVSEGCGHEFGPSFTERIERETGVESRFARLAHVVRGGTPTLEDRLLSSQMGVYAVEQLLEGKSNIVICARDGKIVSTEIRYALALDRMYKNKLNPGDLDPFTEEQIAEMRAFCDRKRQDLLALYAKVDLLGL